MGRVTCPLPLPEPSQNTFTNSGSFLLHMRTSSYSSQHSTTPSYKENFHKLSHDSLNIVAHSNMMLKAQKAWCSPGETGPEVGQKEIDQEAKKLCTQLRTTGR